MKEEHITLMLEEINSLKNFKEICIYNLILPKNYKEISKISKQNYLTMIKQINEVLNKYFIKDISNIIIKNLIH